MSPLRWSRWGLLSLFCTAGAWAAEGDDPAALFTKLDSNSDGQLTVEEVPEEHRPHFERLLRRGDKDENKTLTKEEFQAAHAPDAEPEAPAAPQGPGGSGRPNPGEIFERIDANKDGKLQKSEVSDKVPERVREMLNRIFEKAGKDEITREELMRSIGEAARGAGGGSGEMLQRLKGLDKNGDGTISKDEIPDEGAERLRGLMERLGGGDSIDLKKAEEFAARMEREGGPRPEGRPGEGRPEGDRGPRPEGRGPDGERRGPPEGRPEGRPDGDRPRPEGDREMPERRGPDGRGPEGPGRGGLMRLLDENHDGRLSRQEFSQAATFFADLDMNRDGSLDPSELMGGPGGPGGREMGPDGRGPRPDGDFRPGPDGERMREGDRPAPRGEGDRPRPDGERPRPEGDRPRPEGDRPDGDRPPGGRPDGARFGNPGDFWKQLDKNGDGSLTKEEAPERMRENFDSLDADKDGKVTQDEFRKGMEERFGRGGPGGRPGRPEGERRPARPEGEEPKADKPNDSQ
jgi:Ca2+-binding EF-hand superfamily protein